MNTARAGLGAVEGVCLQGSYIDRDDDDVQKAKRGLFQKLTGASAGTVVPVDLSAAVLRSSCLGEVLGDALEGIARGKFEGRYIVVVDPTGRHDFELDAAIEKESKNRQEKLVCVWRGPEVRLAGQVDRQVAYAYGFVREHWASDDGATARRLAKQDKTSIQAASNRLAKAVRLGVIHPAERSSVEGGGSQWLYVPVL